MKDPFISVIERYNSAKVEYIVVGVSGINYYARTPAQMLATIDYDIFLRPAIKNVKNALTCLSKLNYRIFTGDEPVIVDDFTINKIVEHRASFIAISPQDARIKNTLTITGFSFDKMISDARTFKNKEIIIKVGSLIKLLKSKELANWPKDRDFFKRYRLILEEMDE